jgi:uncharacterized membrane protein
MPNPKEGGLVMANIHIFTGGDETVADPSVRQISFSDVFEALRLGLADFWEKPSHYVFLCLIYPIVGVVLLTWTSGGNVIQLVYPLLTGFALLGPIAAIGLYEISRRREQNLDTSWVHALEVRNSPAVPAILAIGVMLLVLFVAWMFAAQALYGWLYGSEPPASILGFVKDVLTTERGWTLIILGNAVGFVFAVAVLCSTVIAFPLLLDRDVGVYSAVRTSIRAVLANPMQMIFWGLIVSVALLIGTIPLLIGLAIIIPVLGHSTWHLYRKVVQASEAK